MAKRDILAEIALLNGLVQGWAETGVGSNLERDLALERLRRLYDMILQADVQDSSCAHEPLSEELPKVAEIVVEQVVEESCVVVEPEVVAQAEQAESPSEDEPQAEEYVSEAAEEPSVPEQAEPAKEQEVEPAAAEEPKQESAKVEEPVQASVAESKDEPSLFGGAHIEQRKRKQRIIMSLYGDDSSSPEVVTEVVETKEQTVYVIPETDEIDDEPSQDESNQVESTEARVAETQPEPTPIEPVNQTPAQVESEPMTHQEPNHEPKQESSTEPKILADVIGATTQTLADRFASSQGTVPTVGRESVSDLRSAVDINDRFLLMRDLFGGDAAACDSALERLNEFTDLDDCMIYVAETYSWNPNCDGSKLMMELLERKLG